MSAPILAWFWSEWAGGSPPPPPTPTGTVPERTPNLHIRCTWRPEQFDRVTNPDFLVNTAGWSVAAGINAAGTSIARATDAPPPGATTSGVLVTTSTDRSGVHFDLGSDRYFADALHASQYVLRIWLKRESGGRRCTIELGSIGTAADRARLVIPDLLDEWFEYAVPWRPSDDRTDASFAIMTHGATTLRIGRARVYSPLASQVENGSFLTTTMGWTATSGVTIARRQDGFARYAMRIDTTGGSGAEDGATYDLGTRQFLAGRTYRLRVGLRHVSGSDTPRLQVGLLGTDSASSAPTITTTYAWQTLDWTPLATTRGVSVRIDEGSNGPGIWDASEVEVYEAIDDLTPRDLDVTVGATSSGGDDMPTGTTTAVIPDLDGTYDPRNTESPLAGWVTTGRPFHARADWGGRLYGLAWGRLTLVSHDPYEKMTTVTCSDGLGELEGIDTRRAFRSDASFAMARREVLLEAGLSAQQLALSLSGPESATFYDGTDDAEPVTSYLSQLDAATGTIHIAEASPHANVGWAYRTIDRAQLTDDRVGWSIDDDSRGPLPANEVRDDTLVTAARATWHGYDPILAPVRAIDTVTLPWTTVAAPLGHGVIVIGADPGLYPSEVPYLRYTMEAFGSTETPEPEEVWTVRRGSVRVRRKHRRMERIKVRRRHRSLRWDEPVFPMRLDAGESRELVIDFLVPIEDLSVHATGTATVSSEVEVGRVAITVSAGTSAARLDGLAIIGAPRLPLPDDEATWRSATVPTQGQVPDIDAPYVNGPGQAEGLARYLVWRYEESRLRPVARDALDPVRQLGIRIGDRVTATVTRYRIVAMPTVVRGVHHQITRPMPWYTEYALEELPVTGPYVTIDGGAALGILGAGGVFDPDVFDPDVFDVGLEFTPQTTPVLAH